MNDEKKLISGRWVLTMIAGFIFLILACAYVWNPEHSISAEALTGLLTMVFASYFHKERNGKT